MYKGQKGDDELSISQKAIKTLGAKVEKIQEYDLRDAGRRKIYIITKLTPTDRTYPRGKNMPKIRPIL